VAAGPSSTSYSSQYPPTVILPGYGAGIGFFYLNIPALGTWAARRHSPVFAVDWLGMGRSARVPFRIKAKREDIAARVDQSERFFTDALEEWRIKQGFETMALVGHSLGGYLSVAYALRYPTRVNKLILLSPAGVPRDPNGIEESSPGAPAPDAKELKERREALRIARRNESLFRRFATWAWEEGWSPFQIVRSIVFWGPLLVGKVHPAIFMSIVFVINIRPFSIRLGDSLICLMMKCVICMIISGTSHLPKVLASTVFVCLCSSFM